MFDSSMPVTPEVRELQQQWKWLLVLGIVLILVGSVAIAYPLFATAGIVTVIGIVMLAAGIAQIVSAFSSARWSGVFVHIMVGILYGVTGFFVLENKLTGAAALTLLLAAFFVVSGIFRIVFALRERFLHWGWTLFGGALSLLLGIIIWRQMPEASLWLIGLLVGIDLIFTGWTSVMLALAVRSIGEHKTA